MLEEAKNPVSLKDFIKGVINNIIKIQYNAD
jgi:hypothetical protein